ncbi:Aluminum-activated malate transporter, partial [Cynara cardunculus var. scolymus]
MAMENGSSPPSSSSHQNPSSTLFATSVSKMKHVILEFKKIGEDDPRRIVHSLKVALAITLVSMVYYLQPFYNGMGEAGMWAILTVAVVFEYTVGFATLIAGALGLGAESFASLFGTIVKPIVIGCLVFVLVACATFSRFSPAIKRRYDYGILLFILTFSMVAVTGYRVDKIMKFAHQRLSTIIFGGVTCIIVTICICPVWAGEDLHNLIVLNLEKLASFLEGFGGEYYRTFEGDRSFLTSYKSVSNSKLAEESLIGVSTRRCAYHIEALNGYLDAVEVPSEFQKTIQEPLMKVSSEVGKALKELGLSMKLMMHPSASAIHMENCKRAVDELNITLQASMIEKWDMVEMIAVIATVSTLSDVIKCVETISEDIEELSKQALFKKPKDIAIDQNGTFHDDKRDWTAITVSNMPGNVAEL